VQALKRFVPLNKALHDRSGFDCGKALLNTFIQRNASQGMKAKLNFTWVLPAAGIARGEKKPICAFYTLSVCHIERSSLPDNLAKSYPNYPLPVFILAQLAVDNNCQGQRLGISGLINALRRCVKLSQGGEVAGIAVIVDVVDEDALGFYQRFGGFRALKSENSSDVRLFIPMKQIMNL